MTFAQLLVDLQALPPDDLEKPVVVLCRNCRYYDHDEWGTAVGFVRTDPEHEDFPDNPAIDVP